MKLQYFYYAKRREETAMKQLWKRNAVVWIRMRILAQKKLRT